MYFLLISMMLNIDTTIDQTYSFSSQQECQSQQATEIQLLDKLNETSIIGYSTQCVKS